MKLSLILGLISIILAVPTEVRNDNQLQLVELNEYLKRFTLENGSDLLVKRENNTNVFFDSVLSLVKTSGVANVLVKEVLLSPSLLELTSNAVIFILKLNIINYEDLFRAIEQSGIFNQILLGSLDDTKLIQGVLRLGLLLLKKNIVGIYLQVNPPPPGMFGAITNTTKVRELEHEFTKVSAATSTSLTTRENKLFNDLARSLKDSGLIVSVLQYIMTDPELTEPTAQLIINILQSGAVPICDLVHILEDTGILVRIVQDALSDQQILAKFGDIIIGRINSGLIPSTSVDFLLNYVNQNTTQTGAPKYVSK